MNTINCSIGNPYITNEGDVEKYRQLQDWLDSYTSETTLWLLPDKMIFRHNGKRTFRYPRHVTLEWIQSKVRYMVENNI